MTRTVLAGCRILHTLSVRYGLDMIYTYSSNILIAVRAPSPSAFIVMEGNMVRTLQEPGAASFPQRSAQETLESTWTCGMPQSSQSWATER